MTMGEWWTEGVAEVCENFQMDISCLVDGELDEAAASRAMLHLESCGDCKEFFDGTVALNTTFVADSANAGAGRLSSNTFVHIYDLSGNLLQTVGFHTSCSQPLFTGDQFGSILLTDFTVQVKPPKAAKAKKGKK